MDELRKIISSELAEPVDPRVRAMAEAIARQLRGAARAVLFYGSCLRERMLDGLMLDFYVIVSDYREAYEGRWLAAANRWIPPNVFPFVHEGLTAKYAVLSEADFARECGPAARSTSVFARFAQPARLVWVADEEARTEVSVAVVQAVKTLLGRTRETLSAEESADSLRTWRAAFDLTYKAELRAERTSRPGAIVDADPDRFRRLGELVLEGTDISPAQQAQARKAWRRDQRRGKWLSVIRLAKASFTFAGGIDYLAWKINRHAGTQIELAPWQRRWPLLGALILLPRLWARGVIR